MEIVKASFSFEHEIDGEEILRTYESIFDWREGIVLVLLSGAILAFAIFALEKASGLSGDEKREIGILKAIGWEDEVLGRSPDLLDGISDRVHHGLPARVSLFRRAF